jgi:hypothetical protein
MQTPDNKQTPAPEQAFTTAINKYLADFADDGHSIIPSEDLIKYGFSGPWLRDLEEVHPSSGGKWDITVSGEPVDHFKGVWSLTLLEAVANELGIGPRELEAAAHVVGCIPNPMGRGTSARLYTAAIRAALGSAM